MKNDKNHTNKTRNWEGDELPDGLEKEGYLQKNKEWPNLDKRLGYPRIMTHHYFHAVFEWIQENGLDYVSFLDAGCGHGNDLRKFRDKFQGQGFFLGVDLSQAEIIRGLKFYAERDDEDTEAAAKMFAIGNLCDLKKLHIWDKSTQDFTKPKAIGNKTFDVVYTWAVLHGLGYGFNTYHSKKAAAQKFINEIARVSKNQAKLFGRVNLFSSSTTAEERLTILREHNEWQFIPEVKEFEEMLHKAGFSNIEETVTRHEKADTKPSRAKVLTYTFMADKNKP